MDSNALKALASRIHLEVFSCGNLDAIDEIYVAALVPEMRKIVTHLRTTFPDLEIAIDHLIAEGEKVACGWTATGTQKGWFFKIPPTNARAQWTGVSIYVVNTEGKVAEQAGTWDLFGLMRLLRANLR